MGEHMDKHGYSQEDIMKIKAFRWFGNSQIKQVVKEEIPTEDEKENVNEEMHQFVEDSLEEVENGDDDVKAGMNNSLIVRNSAEDEFPTVTSTTEDEANPVSSTSTETEEISDDEESPVGDVMTEYLDKITLKMTTMENVSSNFSLMQDIQKTLAEMKNSLKVKGGVKRPAPAPVKPG